MGSVSVDRNRIARALQGELPYDELSGPEQSSVRSAWDVATSRRIGELDFEKQFVADGVSWSEGLPDGSAVRRGPTADH